MDTEFEITILNEFLRYYLKGEKISSAELVEEIIDSQLWPREEVPDSWVAEMITHIDKIVGERALSTTRIILDGLVIENEGGITLSQILKNISYPDRFGEIEPLDDDTYHVIYDEECV